MTLTEFFGQFKSRSLSPGTILVSPSENPEAIFYLKSGHIRQYSITEDGTEITIHIYNPGSFFPLTWGVANIPNTFGFQATSKSEVIVTPKEPLLDFLRANPDYLLELTDRLLRGLLGLSHRIEAILTLSAHDRVWQALTYFAKHFGSPTPGGTLIDERLTHAQIAAFVGVTRERVSLEIEKLAKEGRLRYANRKITLLSPFSI